MIFCRMAIFCYIINELFWAEGIKILQNFRSPLYILQWRSERQSCFENGNGKELKQAVKWSERVEKWCSQLFIAVTEIYNLIAVPMLLS